VREDERTDEQADRQGADAGDPGDQARPRRSRGGVWTGRGVSPIPRTLRGEPDVPGE
jgi:hypothetical protein